MSKTTRKVISILATFIIILCSVAAWFFIEISYDGCCGAPLNSSNDKLQSLSHLGGYLVAIVAIYLIIRWAWFSKK